MDEERRRRSRLRSFAIGGVVGAAGTIATVRRLRRTRGVRATAGLAAGPHARCRGAVVSGDERAVEPDDHIEDQVAERDEPHA